MTRVISLVLGVAILLSTGTPAHAGTTPPARFAGFDDGLSSPFGYRSDLISVTFNAPGAADPMLGGRPSAGVLQRFLGETGLELDEFTEGVNVYVMRLPEGVDPATMIRRLERNPLVRAASAITFGQAAVEPPLGVETIAYLPVVGDRAMAYTANDPNFLDQWNLFQIDAPSSWDVVSGGFMIGIMDSGIRSSHADLNYGGGINFSSDGSPGVDVYGHGTAMAGIAAARTQNAAGNSGVASWAFNSANVYSIKVLTDGGSIQSNWFVNALNWAATSGPSVLNASLVLGCTTAIYDAIYFAYQNGRVVIGSTGNSDSSNFNGLCPAASAYAIAVGGTNGGGTPTTDKRWSTAAGDPGPSGYGSNYGSPGVNVAAPSTWIWVTHKDGGYQKWSWAGTSGATAHVSGLVSLLKYKYGNPSPAWIRDRLHATAQEVGGYSYPGGGASNELGYGRINSYNALAW